MNQLLAGKIYVGVVAAAVVVILGVDFMARLGKRRRLTVCLVLAAAMGLGVASLVRKPDIGPVTASDLILPLLVFPSEGFSMLRRLRNLSRQPASQVEHALPRDRTGEWQFLGLLVAALGLVGLGLCAYLACVAEHGGRLWLFAPMTALLLVWGVLAFRTGGRVEFGRDFLRLGSHLFPWQSLGKFEWYEESGAALLRIQIRHSAHDLRIRWPEDAAVEAVLVRHGLQRW